MAISAFLELEVTSVLAGSPWLFYNAANSVAAVQRVVLPDLSYVAANLTNDEIRYFITDTGEIPTDAVISFVTLSTYTQVATDGFTTPSLKHTFDGTVGGAAITSGPASIGPASDHKNFTTNPHTGAAWTRSDFFGTAYGVKVISGGNNPTTESRLYSFSIKATYTTASVSVNTPTVGAPGGDLVTVTFAQGNGGFTTPSGDVLNKVGTWIALSPSFDWLDIGAITIVSPAQLRFTMPPGHAVGTTVTILVDTFTPVIGTTDHALTMPDVLTVDDGGVWWFWDSPPFISGIDIGPFYWFGPAPPPFPGWDTEDAVAPSPDGWWMSVAAFGGSTLIIANGRPKNPRTWDQISGFATGSAAWLGGSPGIAAIFQNRMVYAGSDYTVGTTYPPIRIYDGSFDRELCRLPPTAAGAIPKAIVSLLVANGTIYVATWDSGTTSADWVGRVFSLELTTATLTPIGAAFTTGHLPYALAWHNGMLWAGTHRQAASAVGAIFRIRPGIDTTWTQDVALTGQAGAASLLSWRGTLYAGLTAAAATFGKVWARAANGTWSTVDTGSGGAATANNGYLSMAVFNDALYAAYWNADTPAVATIRKTTDGAAWTTVYTGAAGTLRPFIVLHVDDGELFAIGGDVHLTAAVVRTDDGTTWTDLTAELPDTDKAALPAVGVLVF